ncbi:restriction endonuclease subunit S [Aeromonas caviae]|uniref:restriction endonuclease subunit S n=1 Tax=Aeromonas caviae TaxID=648 RepID=UPI0023AA8D6D|nr:restriction endonuclease subunit S [Aeromonas caviae]WEE23183.1 restriction endonuclease subunit S [Aeromonas caviae]
MIFNSSKFNTEWDTKPLSDLGEFQRGKSRHRPRNDPKLFDNGTYPLVQTGEVKAANLYIRSHEACYNKFGLSQSALWPENTLCITIAANIAETALLGYPMCFPDSIVGFNADPKESSELFMHYVFTYIRKAIQNSASGSIQDNINIEYLTGLRFKIPPKTYQDKIVNILSALDKKIELNNRINAELEAMAKTLYDYWFVQFDFPDANGKPYKTSGGKMVYNPTLKRDIPEGWSDASLVDIATFTNGIACQKYYTSGDEPTYKVIKIREFSSGFDDSSESVRQTVPEKVIVNDGDILFSWSATLEVKLWTGGTGVLNQHIFKVTSDRLPKTFYYFEVLKYLDYFKMVAELRKTTMGHITKDHLIASRISLPPKELIQAMDAKLSPILSKIISNSQQNTQLAKLRDWLLPMLMNGQVTVK